MPKGRRFQRDDAEERYDENGGEHKKVCASESAAEIISSAAAPSSACFCQIHIGIPADRSGVA